MRERIKHFFENKRNRVKFRALMLLLFLLGVNTFAWFIYISKVGVDLTASVVSWDVTFYDENTEIQHATVVITDMKPGMTDFSKEFRITNRSGVDASFEYTIDQITIFGYQYVPTATFTSDDIATMLTEETPFEFSFLSSDETIDDHSSETFEIGVTWPYEASRNYVKVNKFYQYTNTFPYYDSTGNQVTVSSSTFDSLVDTDSLYYAADDADTYWGEKSADFIAHGGQNSIVIEMTLIVKQAN